MKHTYELYKNSFYSYFPYVVLKDSTYRSDWFDLNHFSFLKKLNMTRDFESHYQAGEHLYGTCIDTFNTKKELSAYLEKLRLVEELRK